MIDHTHAKLQPVQCICCWIVANTAKRQTALKSATLYCAPYADGLDGRVADDGGELVSDKMSTEKEQQIVLLIEQFIQINSATLKFNYFSIKYIDINQTFGLWDLQYFRKRVYV